MDKYDIIQFIMKNIFPSSCLSALLAAVALPLMQGCVGRSSSQPDPLDFPCAVETVDPAPKKVTKRIALLENGDIGRYWYTWLKSTLKRNSDPQNVFTAEGTTLKVSGTDMGCVTTRDAYRDYRLTLEFRYVDNDRQLNKKAARDGGILFHSNGPDGAYGKGIWMYSFEYNIIQGASGDLIVVGNKAKRPDAPHYSCKGNVDPATMGKPSQHWDPKGPEITLKDGGRVRRCDVDLEWKNLMSQPLSPNENPIGEWNTAVVVCKGDNAEFFFNGKKVGEYRELKPSAGRIQLQSEGFGIEYRNIVLEPVD